MKKKRVHVLLISGMAAVVFIFSVRPIRFTYYYLMGNYHHFVMKDYERATSFFSRLFDNPHMARASQKELFLSSYALGMIKQFNRNRKRDKDWEMDEVFQAFPDNIYLHFLNSPNSHRKIFFENLDELSFICLKDQELNPLSLDVINHYLSRGGVSLQWLGHVISFLNWQNNYALAEQLIPICDQHGGRPFQDHWVGLQPLEWDLEDILYGYLLKQKEDLQRMVIETGKQKEDIQQELENRLTDHPGYVNLKKQKDRLNRTIREMKKIYKAGYPGLREKMAQMDRVNRKITEIKNRIQEERAGFYENRLARLKHRMAGVNESLIRLKSKFSETQWISKSLNIYHVRGDPPDGFLKPDDIHAMVSTPRDLLFQEDFDDGEWKDRFLWREWTGQAPSSNGAFYGGMDGQGFRIMGFFAQKQRGKSRPRAGIWKKKEIPVDRGIYMIGLDYQTVYDTEDPTLWVNRQIKEKRLPHSRRQWVKLIWLLSVQESDGLDSLKPLVRIGGGGILRLDNLGVVKLADSPSPHFKEIGIIAGQNDIPRQ